MKDIFNNTSAFSSLSIKDLIEARDLYHYHLMNKKNVVATAIGYYRIRIKDEWPTRDNPDPDNSANKNEARTLENSEVRPYSWPAILVFVEEWKTEQELALKSPTDVVPKTLYLPDGRKVPVCVIEAKRQEDVNDEVNEGAMNFPRNVISGGFPVITYVQQVKRIASIGCLVTDGHLTYALTNKHVTGEKGDVIYTKLAQEQQAIGISAEKQLDKVPFSEVYNGWTVKDTYLNMDVGLIEVNNLNQWNTNVFSIGTLGRMVDLHVGNFSLNLIGQPVKGYGSVSGEIAGEIKALFYRYKSSGGSEYVSDFLIGSTGDQPLNIHHGDSGSILVYENKQESDNGGSHTVEHMPIALLWGQHVLYENGIKKKSPYALATCLSTTCNLLGVDVVRGWNIDQPYIWGKSGHYGIGNLAIDFIKNAGLKKLMAGNLENISFDINDITADWDSKNKELKEKYKKLFAAFCPLADVPDIIWKQPKSQRWGRQGDENVNHYMDADIPCKTYPKEESFLAYATDKSKISVQELTNYYDNIDLKKVHLSTSPNRGIVPLRVWQIFNYMTDALQQDKPDIPRFIFSAGVLAHYIGDSCQPLHSSYMSDGDPAEDKTITDTAKRDSFHRDGTISHKKGDPVTKVVNPGKGVHSAYEDAMIDDKIAEWFSGIQSIAQDHNHPVIKEKISPIDDGQAAGYAVIELMRKTHETLAPATIVSIYKQYKDEEEAHELMWQELGTPTIDCMARGARYLAAIWEAAWKIAKVNEEDIPDTNYQSAQFRKKLKTLYNNPNELKSYRIDDIGKVLK